LILFPFKCAETTEKLLAYPLAVGAIPALRGAAIAEEIPGITSTLIPSFIR